jgi:hypothetical protein
LSNPIELPSLQEIDEMDRQRLQAIEALEISDGKVKCQKCGNAFPLLSTSSKPNSVRIRFLKQHLRSLERYSQGSHRNINSKARADANIKEVQQELAGLLEEEAKADALRRLPLHSSKISGFKWICGECFERAYKRRRTRQFMDSPLKGISRPPQFF